MFAYVIFCTMNYHMYSLLKLHAHSFCFAEIRSKGDNTKKKRLKIKNCGYWHADSIRKAVRHKFELKCSSVELQIHHSTWNMCLLNQINKVKYITLKLLNEILALNPAIGTG